MHVKTRKQHYNSSLKSKISINKAIEIQRRVRLSFKSNHLAISAHGM